MHPSLEPALYETARLRLRPWRDEDRLPYAALNADPEVREYFPGVLDFASSEAERERIQDKIEQQGWGFWAVELKETGAFIGFTGLNASEGLPCSPCVEIGWRLARAYWERDMPQRPRVKPCASGSSNWRWTRSSPLQL